MAGAEMEQEMGNSTIHEIWQSGEDESMWPINRIIGYRFLIWMVISYLSGDPMEGKTGSSEIRMG
jgi:uncharacterized protein (UPF0297 family)